MTLKGSNGKATIKKDDRSQRYVDHDGNIFRAEAMDRMNHEMISRQVAERKLATAKTIVKAKIEVTKTVRKFNIED